MLHQSQSWKFNLRVRTHQGPDQASWTYSGRERATVVFITRCSLHSTTLDTRYSFCSAIAAGGAAVRRALEWEFCLAVGSEDGAGRATWFGCVTGERTASAEDRASAVLCVFQDRLIKRQLSLKILDAGELRQSGQGLQDRGHPQGRHLDRERQEGRQADPR